MVWGAIAGGLASSLLPSLLGGGGDSGQQTTTNTPWNSQQLQELMTMGKDRYEAGPNTYYPGSTVADMDPRLQQTLNQMMGFGSSGLPAAGSDALSQAMQGTQSLGGQVGQEQVSGTGDYAKFLMNQAQGGQPGNAGQIAANADPTAAFQQFLGGSATNPYVDQLVGNVTSDISRNLNENIMPRIDQGSLANNAYGGSRQGVAQAGAIDSANRQAGNAATSIRANAYESDQGRKLSAANSMLGAAGSGDAYQQSLQQMGLSGANLGRGLFQDLAGITSQQASMAPLMQAYEGMNLSTQAQGGQAQQQYLQSLLSDKVNAYNFNQQADDQNFQNYANLLLNASGSGGTTTQNTPQASIGERLLGGVSSGIGVAGQLQNLFGQQAQQPQQTQPQLSSVQASRM